MDLAQIVRDYGYVAVLLGTLEAHQDSVQPFHADSPGPQERGCTRSVR